MLCLVCIVVAVLTCLRCPICDRVRWVPSVPVPKWLTNPRRRVCLVRLPLKVTRRRCSTLVCRCLKVVQPLMQSCVLLLVMRRTRAVMLLRKLWLRETISSRFGHPCSYLLS